MSKFDALDDYYFHYNIYTQKWEAFLNNKTREYKNGELKEGELIISSSINDIVRYILNPSRLTNIQIKR